MTINTEPYLEQLARWPQRGKHILAHFDDDSIIVYQAYGPTIGEFATRNGSFGAGFSYNRMSWIKPNFLWMMYRSNWGRSEGQQVVLAIRLRRTFFDSLLERAVPSSFDADSFESRDAWKTAVEISDVRLQWDPDHRPDGSKEERRAIQIGMRGDTLEAYGRREILEILDMSDFVASQREHARIECYDQIAIPVERVYWPAHNEIASRIGLSAC